MSQRERVQLGGLEALSGPLEIFCDLCAVHLFAPATCPEARRCIQSEFITVDVAFNTHVNGMQSWPRATMDAYVSRKPRWAGAVPTCLSEAAKNSGEVAFILCRPPFVQFQARSLEACQE